MDQPVPGPEPRNAALVEPLGVPFIVTVDFPEIPKMPDEEDWSDISLDQLRTRDWAPENPALLRRLQLGFSCACSQVDDVAATLLVKCNLV